MPRRQLDAVSTAAHFNGSPGYNAFPSPNNDRLHHSNTSRPTQKHYSQPPPPIHRQRDYIATRPQKDTCNPVHPAFHPSRTSGAQQTYIPRNPNPNRSERITTSGPPHYPRPNRTGGSGSAPPPPPPAMLPPKQQYSKPRRPVEVHNSANNYYPRPGGRGAADANYNPRRSSRRVGGDGQRRVSDPGLVEVAGRAKRAQSGPPKRVRFSI